MDWQAVILPIVLAIIAAVPGTISLFRGRQKERADVAKAITEAAGELVEDYQRKLSRLEEKLEQQAIQLAEQAEQIRCQDTKIERQAAQLAEQAESIKVLERERGELLAGVLMLCAQIRKVGHEPVWEPESSKGKN